MCGIPQRDQSVGATDGKVLCGWRHCDGYAAGSVRVERVKWIEGGVVEDLDCAITHCNEEITRWTGMREGCSIGLDLLLLSR